MRQSSNSSSSCPNCCAPLVEIRLGADLRLRSCSNCDSRWWLRADQPAELDAVLRLVTATDGRRPQLRASA